MPLHIRGAESDRDQPTLRFIGVGYRRERLGETSPLLHRAHNDRLIPNEQLIVLPEQLASLSTEQLPVGDVPLFSSTTRAVFVNNLSYEHAIQFRWEPIRFVQAGQALEVLVLVFVIVLVLSELMYCTRTK